MPENIIVLRCRFMLLFAGLLSGFWTWAWAPGAAADEVDRELDARIRAHRQAEVSFVVLGREDQGAEGAVVEVQQESHAFRVGFRMAADGPPLPATFDPDAPGWRVFNAVSLAERTGWRDLQPQGPADFAGRRVRAALTEAARARLAARWGPLVPGSVYDLPEWAVSLRGDDLRRVLVAYLERVVGTYGRTVTGIDLPGRPADGRLGFRMVRLLQQGADALAPGTPLNLAFGTGLTGPEARPGQQAADAAAKQFVGHRGLTLGALLGPSSDDALDAALNGWRTLGLPGVVEPLTVNDDPALDRGENLRRVLRRLFAEPWIQGVYFDASAVATKGDQSAALFETAGDPTAAGRVLDVLFAQTWWTQVGVTAGPGGRAAARVFYGRHRVTVTLPDATVFTTALWVGPGENGPRTVVLQPVSETVRAEPSAGPVVR